MRYLCLISLATVLVVIIMTIVTLIEIIWIVRMIVPMRVWVIWIPDLIIVHLIFWVRVLISVCILIGRIIVWIFLGIFIRHLGIVIRHLGWLVGVSVVWDVLCILITCTLTIIKVMVYIRLRSLFKLLGLCHHKIGSRNIIYKRLKPRWFFQRSLRGYPFDPGVLNTSHAWGIFRWFRVTKDGILRCF
jgi:hypothetical protein